MSAPLVATAENLRALADAIDDLTRSRAENGVDFAPYSPLTLSIADNYGLQVRWSDDLGQYVVDDQVGS